MRTNIASRNSDTPWTFEKASNWNENCTHFLAASYDASVFWDERSIMIERKLWMLFYTSFKPYHPEQTYECFWTDKKTKWGEKNISKTEMHGHDHLHSQRMSQHGAITKIENCDHGRNKVIPLSRDGYLSNEAGCTEEMRDSHLITLNRDAVFVSQPSPGVVTILEVLTHGNA